MSHFFTNCKLVNEWLCIITRHNNITIRHLPDVLHWQRILYQINHCLSLAVPLGLALAYLQDLCCTWVFRVVALSALLRRVSLSSLLPAQQLSWIMPSQWLAPCSGLDYLWHWACSLRFSVTPFMLTKKFPF